MPIVTLAEAKQQLRIPADNTDSDDELTAYVNGIGRVVENYLHEVVEQRTVTEDVEASGRSFRLWNRPVLSLTSVAAAVSGASWDVTQMRVSDSGLVRVLSGPPVTGLVTVTFEAGYAEVPENYKRGALVALQHVWETRRGMGTVAMGVVGGEEQYDPRFSYSIPRKALEWLGAPNPVVG